MKRIEVSRYTGSFGEIAVPLFPNHVAVIYLNRNSLDLVQRLDGQLRKERVHCGEVAIIPEGLAWE